MTPVDVTESTLVRSVIDVCVLFSIPPLQDEFHVLNGFQNNVTPPPDGNDFCAVYPVGQVRVGTNAERYTRQGDEVMQLENYVEVSVQVDCYSKRLNVARERAQTYETVARSSKGVAHFKQYGIDCQYGGQLQNNTGLLDSDEYVARWTLTLTLGYWKAVRLTQDYATEVIPNVINIDAKFKP